MLFHLIRKELLDQLLSLRFSIANIVCVLVFVLSSVVLTREYREAASTLRMNQVMHRNTILKQDEIHQLWDGISVDRSLNFMNLLVRGVSSEFTESIHVWPGNQLDFPEAYEQNPVVPLFPAVDFAFIVGIIMSLLALAFSYDAVSGERESGVLKIVMSYSVPRDSLLLGKWIGSYLALIGPFVVAFLLGLVIAVLFSEVEISIDHTLAVIGLLALALLYLSAVFSLGILISCRTQIASTSITVLLLIWVAFILAIPSMAPFITDQFVTVPSRVSVDREKVEIQQEGQRELDGMVKAERNRTGKQEVWDDPVFADKLEQRQKQTETRIRKVEDSYIIQVQDQTRWASLVARLSPLTSFHLASLALAAAGVEQEVHFVDALRKYSKTWEEYTRQKEETFEQSRQTGADDERVDLSDYPRFSFQHMTFEERLSQVYLDVLLLVFWNLLLFMLAYVSFLRYDVR